MRPTSPIGTSLVEAIPRHTLPPGDSESPPTCHSEPQRGISLPSSDPLTLCHPNAPQEILLASTHPTVPIPRRLPHLPQSPTTPPPQQRPIPKPTPSRVGTSLVASSPISPHSLSCHPQRPPNIPVGASVERPSPSRVVPLHSRLPVGAVREPPVPVIPYRTPGDSESPPPVIPSAPSCHSESLEESRCHHAPPPRVLAHAGTHHYDRTRRCGMAPCPRACGDPSLHPLHHRRVVRQLHVSSRMREPTLSSLPATYNSDHVGPHVITASIPLPNPPQ